MSYPISLVSCKVRCASPNEPGVLYLNISCKKACNKIEKHKYTERKSTKNELFEDRSSSVILFLSVWSVIITADINVIRSPSRSQNNSCRRFLAFFRKIQNQTVGVVEDFVIGVGGIRFNSGAGQT